MTDEQFIKLGLEANLLNYVDNETPRRYFVCGNADLEDVKDFARLVSQEQVKEIERLREALAVIYKAADTERGENDEYWWVDNQTTVQSYICSVLGAPPEDALGEGKE